MKPHFLYEVIETYDPQMPEHRVSVWFDFPTTSSLEGFTALADAISDMHRAVEEYRRAGNHCYVTDVNMFKMHVFFVSKSDAMRFRLNLGL